MLVALEAFEPVGHRFVAQLGMVVELLLDGALDEEVAQCVAGGGRVPVA